MFNQPQTAKPVGLCSAAESESAVIAPKVWAELQEYEFRSLVWV